ncbi:flagellar basal-body rod protein FlgB [Roseovarius atlanticus]|uniref:Flagellar basal body rod protein FlgB n=2 Tax=Roseovarius atlanticus TaxID=1641875 RepID=A0A0T5NRH6_9RHOB|nr:flagellar basal-body rod protein FlgB [Roseovarius atlanticus]
MFENLEVFRMAHAMAKHAGARQTVIARNMANADTPDYVARDIAPFQAELETKTPAFAQAATRARHLNGAAQTGGYEVFERGDAMADPNGNAVSVESEMLHAVDTKRQHDRAVTIYKSALTILRTAVRR